MTTRRTIFLTGATGLVGSYLLKLFLQHGHRVYVLARGKKEKSAQQRVKDYVTFWDKEVWEIGSKNLLVVEGDIVYPDLGIKNLKITEELISEVEIIYHSAALAKLKAPLEVITKVNVEGTKNVLDFASMCKEKGKLKKVNYISTAYVAGTIGKINFTEDMLELGQGFHNIYEQTKYQAELIVKEYQKKGLNISVFRPSLVMGDSIEGKTTDFRLFYEPLHFFSQEIYDEFPADVNCFENMINIDTVANALFVLGDLEKARVYHLVSPDNTNMGFFIKLASDFFKFKMPKLSPFKNFSFDRWDTVQKALAEPFVPYFNYETSFFAKETQGMFSKKGFVFSKIDEQNFIRVFEYCKERKFIGKKNLQY
ncbi:MAG: SDR family oxidoreductase [bacterium]